MSEATRLHETGTLADKMTCPYNVAHVMTAYKYQAHLIKCRKQNPDKAKFIKICPYNQTHHIPEDGMSLHLTICPEYLHFQRTVVASRVINEQQNGPLVLLQTRNEVTPNEAEQQGMSSIMRLMDRPRTPSPPPTTEDVDDWA